MESSDSANRSPSATDQSQAVMEGFASQQVPKQTLKPHKVGVYDVLNPGKLCELENCEVHTRPRTIFSVPKSVIEKAEARALKLQEEEEHIEQLFTHPSITPFQARLLPKGPPGKSISTLAEPSLIDAQDAQEAEEFERIDFEHVEHVEPVESVERRYSSEEGFTQPPSWYVLQNEEQDQELEPFVPGTWDFVDSNIFDSEEDRYRALRAHDSQFGLNMSLQRSQPAPLMFTYGIRYAPEPYPSPIESRMILITGLPSYTPIAEIMARVRGGQIVRVITATSPAPVGFTVVIHFTEHENAKSYADYMKKNATVAFAPGVKVTLGTGHSYPMPSETEEDLGHGFTRLLSFGGFYGNCPKQFLNNLESVCQRSPQEILEDLWLNDEGVLFILFKDVSQASRYYKTVIWEQTRSHAGAFYSDLHRFVRDPCDQPLDDLQGPIRLAREPWPSLLEDWIEGKAKENGRGTVTHPTETCTTETCVTDSHATAPPTDANKGESSQQVELPSDKILREFAEANGLTHLSVYERFGEYQGRYLSSITPFNRSFSSSGGNMTPTSSNFTGDLAYQYWQDHGDDGKGKEPMKSTESPRGAEASREPSTGESSPETATLPNESPKSDTQSPYSGGVFPSSLDDDDDTLVPKYMLPQNDPAYFELLTRDHSDLVRRSEANAIWCQQEAKSIPKEEMRARYSAFFPVREQMAAWKSGYEYDPNAPGMPEAEQDSGVVIKQETPDTDAQK